ncbi:hypothetical protein I4U23_013578 [Adineta vaga]|nr:hypothetical protein I4U23_013578 [Adineta vaga]
MDLRVYVDGVARIICDLTRTTTVHDIIIALAQYKGKAGRYSLIQRAPDGTQRTLSPNELTCELIHHPDWAYILRQNPSNQSLSNGQKRSKSLDGRKTPTQQQQQQPQHQQTFTDKLSPITSSSQHFRTIPSSAFVTLTSDNKKRANIHQIFSSINTNNNNNNINHFLTDSTPSSPTSARHRLSRTPISENHHPFPYTRPKSAIPSSLTENSAFHIVHNPNSNYTNIQQQQQQQQQYLALIQILKSQELQVEQQEKELNEKQNEIEYREAILRQTQLYHESIQHELQILEERERRLASECQTYTQEYSPDALDIELDFHEKLHSNYEHLQQQLARCSSTLEQKRQIQEQLQFNIEQIHEEIEQIQTNINNDKKDILQYEYDLQRSNVSSKQQDDLLDILNQRNDDIEHIIQQDQKDIMNFEDALLELEDLLIQDLPNTSYHFHETTTNGTLMPVHLQFMNSTLLKICPSGIWV